MTTSAEDTLADLGFTETEARVYCELLRGGPATGYRLAQAVGKAPANTYQALAALAQKGAVLIDEGETRTHRAVPPGELLTALERGFSARRQEAENALSKLRPAVADDRIYQLQTPAQVFERARTMIAQAREILLFDAFPGPLSILETDLNAAAARGVRVAGLVYGPGPASPIIAVRSHGAKLIGERWPGQQLTLVADAGEHLIALLSHDGASVRHGLWSDSAYLACIQHSGLAAEIRISSTTRQDADPRAALSLLQSYPPGLKTLLGPPAGDLAEPINSNPGDAV